MTVETTCPLVWDPDADNFRPVADVIPDLAEWGDGSPERRQV